MSLPTLPAGYYMPSGTVASTFIPDAGGTFTFNNGNGGKDVGGFNVTSTLPAALSWTNASSVTSVSRSGGVTVTWSGGASGSYVSITGNSSATVSGKTVSAGFSCIAPVSAGTFTVPSQVLLALPAGSGSLGVADYTNYQLFTASGLDLGVVLSGNSVSKSLSYN